MFSDLSKVIYSYVSGLILGHSAAAYGLPATLGLPADKEKAEAGAAPTPSTPAHRSPHWALIVWHLTWPRILYPGALWGTASGGGGNHCISFISTHNANILKL